MDTALIDTLIGEKPIFSRKELADVLGVTEQRLAQLATDKKGPAYVRVGERAVRYPRAGVVAWLMQNAPAVAAVAAV